MAFTKPIMAKNVSLHKAACLLILAVVLLSHARLSIAQMVEKGLVSYWTFDKVDIEGDIAKDVWGKNDGKIVGPKIDTDLVNEALKFDGKDDYVNVTDFSSIDYAELTVEARFKVNQTTSNGLATQNQRDTGGGDFFNIYTSNNILRFGLRASDNKTWHQPNKPFTDTKKWHHFIAVYNGKKSFFYLDGELVAESSDFKICQDAENLVRIGSRSSDFGRPVDGWIDEVLIYNRGLSPKEVEQNFDAEGLAVRPKKASCDLGQAKSFQIAFQIEPINEKRC